MITNNDIEELNTRFHYISQGFGEGSACVDYIRYTSASELEVERKVHFLLSNPFEVRVITPWEMKFYLGDIKNNEYSSLPTTFTSMTPYKVFDIDMNLLYTVSQPGYDFWGLSPLDKVLVEESPTGSIYCLHIETNNGTYPMGLIVNNLSLLTISTQPFNAPQKNPNFYNPLHLSVMETPDEISFINISSIDSNVWADHNSLYVHAWFLPSLPSSNISSSFIKSHTKTMKESFQVFRDYRDSNITYPISVSPTASGWLMFEQELQDGTLIPLTLSNLEGLGGDRLLRAESNIWYVSFSSGIDIVNLKQYFGDIKRRPKDFSTRRAIRTTATLTQTNP